LNGKTCPANFSGGDFESPPFCCTLPVDPVSRSMHTFIAAIRSVAAYLAVSLYVLIAAPIGMALAIAFNWKAVLYILGHWGVAIGTSLAGIRTRVVGREHIPNDRAVVFCSNHQSNIDPPILFQALHPRLHVLFKRELTKLPLLGKVFTIGGFVPIDRGSREQSMSAIDQAAESLKQGNYFLTFPEGTRSRTGAILPFKRGPFLMALKAQVPVVPVAIQGGTAAMKKGSAIVRPVTVSVRIGPPIETRGMDVSDREKLADLVRASVEELLVLGPVTR
jgi:1-acyl-sn-glycerol-3-phosphate acyltransferase